MKKVFRTIWFKLFFSIGFFLLLLEIGLRITGIYKNYGEKNYGYFIDYTKPPYPGTLCVWEPHLTKDQRTTEFSYQVTTNSLGVRDVEHKEQKPEGVKRVALLGDSFTEGVGAPFDSTWGNQLLRLINSDNTCGPWELIQGAAAGGDPFYGYEMYRRKMYKYDPDQVVITFNHTDVFDFMARGGLERFVNDSTVQWRPVSCWLHNAYKYSHVVRMVVKSVLKYNDFYQSQAEEQQLQLESVDAYAQLFVKLDSLVRADGAELLIVFMPMSYECKDNTYYKPDRLLLDKVKAAGLDHVDILPNLPEAMRNDCDSYYWEMDGHMNSKGYGYWAEIIYNVEYQRFCETEP